MKNFTITLTEVEVCKLLDHIESMIGMCEQGDEDHVFYEEFYQHVDNQLKVS